MASCGYFERRGSPEVRAAIFMKFLFPRASFPLVSLWPLAHIAGRNLCLEVAAMPSLWSGRAGGEPQAHMDSVDSFLLKLGLVAGIFVLSMLMAYLAQ